MEHTDLNKIFGSHVFDDRVMRQRLPANIYDSMRRIRDENMDWDPQVADVVAEAMKNWAMEMGATHYIHWFSPLSGLNAGKHESFVDGAVGGQALLRLSGQMLTQGEPDASSFPSGGLRATFEARGYTVWDPASPAFVMGPTLYIPTAFHAYTGEALDQKTPVLRSMQALNKQAVRILRALGDTATLSVTSSVGAEQEYFLVDKELADRRPDLLLCGYTLQGAFPPKRQQMSDHYYAVISDRVRDFMSDLDKELWQLGVPAKTEHNETAPGQYELASVYSSVNVACDHNQLIMEIMGRVAQRHGLRCLLHEKPFAGVNGSGKHNNWSLTTNLGKNLLRPGPNPEENTLFLLFLTAVLTAVDEHAELLRVGATCPGNDFRLGAAEAPPAIISVFLGDKMAGILDNIASGTAQDPREKQQLLTGVKTLPLLELDDNDRNRTSPFAFTGNKFEFRMVGASQSIGTVNAILNAVVADVLRRFADELEAAAPADDLARDAAVADIIKKYYPAHRRIIFNGNNYTAEWVEEAARRGLPNNATAVSAIPALLKPENIELFGRTKVFSESECRSRYGFMMENFAGTKTIAAATLLDMVDRYILPASISYLGELCAANEYASDHGARSVTAANMAKRLAAAVDAVGDAAEALRGALAAVGRLTDVTKRANACHTMSTMEMAALRRACDALEPMVAADIWPFPTYADMLFNL